MNDRIKIKVADLIGSPFCISADDGQKVYDNAKKILEQGKQVTISFENTTMLISLFLNVAIGQLYSPHTEDAIRQLNIEGLSEDDQELLERVVDNAKKYYKNPKAYDNAWLDKEEGED